METLNWIRIFQDKIKETDIVEKKNKLTHFICLFIPSMN
jgi:hypothetical protein